MKGEQKSKFKNYKNLFRILQLQLSETVYQHIKDKEEAKEIVQEVFLNAWGDYTKFDNENDKAVFFHDTVVNKCVNHINDKQKSKFKSYRDLFKRLHPELSALAYQYVKDKEEAKEIVQEVFLDGWVDYTVFDNENDKTDFFYEVVINKCVQNIKDR